MTKNPFINAAGAAVYIGAVMSLMYYGIPLLTESGTGEPPLLFFVSLLSLFVLSVLAMCVSFLLQPFILAFEGKPKEGARLLLQTGGAFAFIVIVLFASLFLFFS